MKRFTILMGILAQVLAMHAVIIPDEDIIPGDSGINDYWWPMKVNNGVVYKGNWKPLEGGGGFPDYSDVLGVTTSFDVEDLVIMPEYYPEARYSVPYAFEDCMTIKTVIFPASMFGSSQYMFKGCTNITSVDMSAMYHCDNGNPWYSHYVHIGEGSFYGCSSLREVKWPRVFNSIGELAFYGCELLESVVINEAEYSQYWPDEMLGGLTHIDDEAFAGCTGLKYLKLPASLERLGKKIWTDCVNLEEIYYTAAKPLGFAGSKNVFPQVVYENATLYLSQEYADTHPDIRDGLGSPWNQFKHIEIMDFSGIDEISSNGTDSDNRCEIDQTRPYEVYTLNGTRVCTNNPSPQLQSLPKGLYILRQGLRSKKVFIP